MQTFQRFQQHPKKKQLVWGIGGAIGTLVLVAVLWQALPFGVDEAETGTLTDDEVLAEFEASLKSGKTNPPLPTAASLQLEPDVQERDNHDLHTAPGKLPFTAAEMSKTSRNAETDWLNQQMPNETVIRPEHTQTEFPSSPPSQQFAPSQQQMTAYSPKDFPSGQSVPNPSVMNPQGYNPQNPPRQQYNLPQQSDPTQSYQPGAQTPVIQQVNNEVLITPGQPGIQQMAQIPTVPGQTPGVQQRPAVPQTPQGTAALELDQQLEQIELMIQNNDIVSAHRELSKIYWTQPEMRDVIDPMIDQTSRKIFFEPSQHYLRPYVVQPGEQLGAIAKKYNVPWQYLARLNRIEDPSRIQVGQQLKVNRGPFAAVVDLNRYEITIHANNYFVRRYKIGIGRDQATPQGEFTVLDKVPHPQYTSPEGKVVSGNDPSNPLGSRWLALGQGNMRTSYGIHGTIDPRSIGRAESAGCVRMHNADVEVIYDLLDFGSPVLIRP